MAKERKKGTDTVKKTTASRSATKKRKKGRGRKALMIALATFLILMAVLIFVLTRALLATSNTKDKSNSTVNTYDTTPVSLQGRMAYYLVGLLGEKENDATQTLSLVCFDKKALTLSVLDVPQDTYLGDSEYWAVKKVGQVWGNPADLDWCDFEKKQIFAAEKQEHIDAGHTVSKRKGSASCNLISVFNEQYALPVDAYFMIPQQGLVKLVDLLGGIDVRLEKSIKVDTTTYAAGTQTLDGAAALQYLLTSEKGVAGDIARLVSSRRVYLGLFERLIAQSTAGLNDSLVPVMKGSTPIRTNLGTDELVDLVQSMKKITPEKITAQIIPGEATSLNSVAYYSVHRAELIEQLNTYFNPYGEKITEEAVTVTELAKGAASDVHRQVLSDIAVEQSGTVASTTTGTGTTATH